MLAALSLLASLAVSPAHADDTPWKALHAPRAESSSYLRSNWNKFTENYHPTYILDDNPRTAWVEGAPGDGLGSWISWPVSRVSAAHRVKLRLRNGYHKSQKLLIANAAPSRVAIELLDGTKTRFRQEVELDRTLAWQEIILDPPEDVPVDGVKITVLEAHEGSAYQDTCISDVQTFVDADDAYNPVVERAKQAAAQTWIAGRVAAAKAYADLPKTYPFAATRFRDEPPNMSVASMDAHMARIAEARALEPQLDALLAKTRWHRHDVPTGVLPLPDGIRLNDLDRQHLWRWFATDASYFETDKPWRTYREAPRGWQRLMAISNVKLDRGDDGQPIAVAYTTRSVIQERSTDTETIRWLVTFEGGRPSRIIGLGSVVGELGCALTDYTQVYDITWTEDQVSAIRRTWQSQCIKQVEGFEAEVDDRPFTRVEVWVPVP